MSSSPGNRADVLLLGGGIIGLACARALADRGLRVTVVERGRAGMAASAAAAGMLAPLAEVPDDGPFLDACRASRDQWTRWAPELAEESGIDLDYDRSGVLLFDPDDPRRARSLTERARTLGETAEVLDRAELQRRVPDIAPDVGEAVLLPGEHRVDNRRVCEALLRGLAHRGVELVENFDVRRVRSGPRGIRFEGDHRTLEADRAILTGGAWSGSIEGVPKLPIYPVRGQMFELAGVDWPWMGSVWAGHLYTVRRLDHRLLVGATVESVGFVDHPTPAGLSDLLAPCLALFPGLRGKAVLSTWAGLRPGTADGLPILGRLDDNLWIASGHYRNGILLAPWTADLLADALSADVEIPMAFSPDRFAEA